MTSDILHVRHILVQHKYEAEDIHKKLQEGASFDDLARKHSVCSSAQNGGDLGPIAKRKFDLDFLEAVENLPVNVVSAPVRTRFGYHLVERMR
jgi:peptidyl-prolyl cis-trans isomerase C